MVIFLSKYKSFLSFTIHFSSYSKKFPSAKCLFSLETLVQVQEKQAKSMAPVNKLVSSGGYIYEQNNFVAFTDTTQVPIEFNHLMDFIKSCKLSHAMLASPVLHCEVIEAFWTSTRYDDSSKTLSFPLNLLIILSLVKTLGLL